MHLNKILALKIWEIKKKEKREKKEAKVVSHLGVAKLRAAEKVQENRFSKVKYCRVHLLNLLRTVAVITSLFDCWK